MHKISIVTVVYNRPDDLNRTILSCISQIYKNKEYVIIDGGSPQETIDVIKEHEKDIDVWISEPDNGIFNAMNKSLEYISGDYVIFMNAGDVFCSADTLERVFLNKEYNEKIIYGDSILHNNSGYLYRKNASIYETKATLRDYIYKGQGICHQAMFTKVDVLKKIKFNEKYKLGADYDTTAQILKHFPNSYHNLRIPICVFDDVSGGASHRQLRTVINERIEMFGGKKDLFYHVFLVRNEWFSYVKKIAAFMIPLLRKSYRANKYTNSLEELCV